MLALSWLYCAVPSAGNGGAPSCDLYCASACVQIWSNCSCVTTPSPTAAMAPAGTFCLVRSAGGQQQHRHHEGEKGHTNDDLLHRFSLPAIDDLS